MPHTNIAIALDENYAPHAAALIASIFTNSSQNISIYLLTDNLSHDTKTKFLRLGDIFSKKIYVIEGNVENFFVSHHLSKAAYLRLKIPELLPETVGRIIYLDGDILVKGDISELFNASLEGKPIAAAPDLGIMTSRRSMREKAKTLNINETDPYFNSGVLVMDLDKWRKEDYASKLLELVKNNKFRHHDQDALNLVFYDNWHPLPLEYNVIPPIYELPAKVFFSRYKNAAIQAIKNAKIIHYAGGHKPWHYKKTAGFNDYYYEMLEKTPFELPNPQEKTFRKYREMFRISRGKFLSRFF